MSNSGLFISYFDPKLLTFSFSELFPYWLGQPECKREPQYRSMNLLCTIFLFQVNYFQKTIHICNDCIQHMCQEKIAYFDQFKSEIAHENFERTSNVTPEELSTALEAQKSCIKASLQGRTVKNNGGNTRKVT